MTDNTSPPIVPLLAAIVDERFVIYDIERRRYAAKAMKPKNDKLPGEPQSFSSAVAWTDDISKALALPRTDAHEVRSIAINAAEEKGGRPEAFVRMVPIHEAQASTSQLKIVSRQEADKPADPTKSTDPVTLFNKQVSGWYAAHRIDGEQTQVHWTNSPSAAAYISRELAELIRSRGYEHTSIQTREDMGRIIDAGVIPEPIATRTPLPYILPAVALRSVQEYRIEEAGNFKQLQEQVNTLLRQGWSPVGRAFVAPMGIVTYLCQTLTRSIPEDA